MKYLSILVRKSGITILLCIVSLSLSYQSDAQTSSDSPNIVFAFADDWGRYASIYSSYDKGKTLSDVVKTPNFDQLSKNGVLFTNAYTPSPSCTPTRSSIFTGQYFYRTGLAAILHGARWPMKKSLAEGNLENSQTEDNSGISSWPLILKENGYHIGYTYKAWSPGNPVDAPYGGRNNQYQPAGNNFNRFSQFVSKAKDPSKAKKKLMDEVRKNFEDFLSDRKSDQSFSYFFGPTNPHRQWIRGSGKNLWEIDPKDLTGKLPPFLPDNEVIREDLADYLGEVQAFDAALGVLLNKLKDIGELENTIIVVSGDHGVPGIPRAKSNLYDIGTQVPLSIRWGKEVSGDRIVTDFVNLMDLAPTFLEVAGIEPPANMDGKSLLPVLQSNKEGRVDPSRSYVLTGRERHVATAREGNLPYPQRAIRTDRFLYIRNFKPERWPIGTLKNALRDIDGGPTKDWYIKNYDNPEISELWEYAFGKRPYEELYDLKKDPYQLNNIADKASYSAIKNNFAHKMDSLLTATGDPRMTGDKATFDQSPYTRTSERMLNKQSVFEKNIERILSNN